MYAPKLRHRCALALGLMGVALAGCNVSDFPPGLDSADDGRNTKQPPVASAATERPAATDAPDHSEDAEVGDNRVPRRDPPGNAGDQNLAPPIVPSNDNGVAAPPSSVVSDDSNDNQSVSPGPETPPVRTPPPSTTTPSVPNETEQAEQLSAQLNDQQFTLLSRAVRRGPGGTEIRTEIGLCSAGDFGMDVTRTVRARGVRSGRNSETVRSFLGTWSVSVANGDAELVLEVISATDPDDIGERRIAITTAENGSLLFDGRSPNTITSADDSCARFQH